MEHEFEGMEISVEDIDITFEKIYKKPYIPKEYIDDIKNANVLIIPNEKFKEEDTLVFAENTRELFDFLKENSNKLITDIAISDDDFQFVELHSAVIEIATIIVQSCVFSILINVLSSFIYDQVKKCHRNREDTSVHVEIIVEEKKRKKTKKIKYKGPVSGIKDSLDEISKNLFS